MPERYYLLIALVTGTASQHVFCAFAHFCDANDQVRKVMGSRMRDTDTHASRPASAASDATRRNAMHCCAARVLSFRFSRRKIRNEGKLKSTHLARSSAKQTATLCADFVDGIFMLCETLSQTFNTCLTMIQRRTFLNIFPIESAQKYRVCLVR